MLTSRCYESEHDLRQTPTPHRFVQGASVARTVELAEQNIRVMFDRP